MKKLFKDVCRTPRYFLDKLTGKSRIGAPDHAYFENNGKALKVLYEVIKLFGNKYSGK